MKYSVYTLLILLVCTGFSHAMPDLGIDSDGDEPLAIFEVTIHHERANTLPVYSEIHAMTQIEMDLQLGSGDVIEGSWKNIDWRNNLVYIKITKRDAQGATEALSMARFTSKGLRIKKLYNAIEDFSLDLAAKVR